MTNHDENELESAAGTKRRGLLRAAGGFSLAASGLFVPEWLEETAARDGVLDGDLGGRHGQNRRGRHRRRTHGHKKGKRNGGNQSGSPRGEHWFRFVFETDVARGASGSPIHVEMWT